MKRVIPCLVLLGACGAEPSSPGPETAPSATAEHHADAHPDAKLVSAPSPDGGTECLHHDGGDHHGAAAADCDAANVPADGTAGHFGAAFALQQARPLQEAIAELASIGGSPVQVSGKVTSVCQKKGCWMVIEDGTASARVLMKDHAFAVPFDGTGKQATVEGTIEARELSEGQVKHIEEDAGRDPAGVSGPRKEYILTASAVRLDS
jgi:hypothetical protein